jgi:hypothetical protein
MAWKEVESRKSARLGYATVFPYEQESTTMLRMNKNQLQLQVLIHVKLGSKENHLTCMDQAARELIA